MHKYAVPPWFGVLLPPFLAQGGWPSGCCFDSPPPNSLAPKLPPHLFDKVTPTPPVRKQRLAHKTIIGPTCASDASENHYFLFKLLSNNAPYTCISINFNSVHLKIYVVGGFNGNEVLNSCEMYNPTTNSWTLISLMLSPRSGVGLVACNDALYAIGGFSGHHRLRSVEKYSLKDPTWNFVADMICPRSNFASVVIENTIYVIGGFNGTNTISFVESYEPKRNTW